MERYGTLERSWYGVTPGGYPVRVEEHRSDLMYIVEFYDADELSSGQPLSRCPVSGESLDVARLQAATPEMAAA